MDEIITIMEEMNWYFGETTYEKLRWTKTECGDGDHGNTRDPQEGKRKTREEYLLRILENGERGLEDVPSSLVDIHTEEKSLVWSKAVKEDVIQACPHNEEGLYRAKGKSLPM